MDEKGSNVEDYKLTKESKTFSKRIKEINAVTQILQMKGLQKQAELKNITDMLQGIMGQKKQMLAQAPGPRNDIPGMDFSEEGRMA